MTQSKSITLQRRNGRTLLQCFNRGVRRCQIGIAGAEVDDIDAGVNQRLRARRNVREWVRGKSGEALRESWHDVSRAGDEQSGRRRTELRVLRVNPATVVRGIFETHRGLRHFQRTERIHHDRDFVGRLGAN